MEQELGRPGQLGFMGDSNGEERVIQRENPGDLQRVSLEYPRYPVVSHVHTRLKVVAIPTSQVR